MGTQEQPCYTLIQGPTDTEQPSEMQLKQDLGNTCVTLLTNFDIFSLSPGSTWLFFPFSSDRASYSE